MLVSTVNFTHVQFWETKKYHTFILLNPTSCSKPLGPATLDSKYKLLLSCES